ncbi:MAG: hypothetical protein AAF721_41845 [Myxococcota bacterium]
MAGTLLSLLLATAPDPTPTSSKAPSSATQIEPTAVEDEPDVAEETLAPVVDEPAEAPEEDVTLSSEREAAEDDDKERPKFKHKGIVGDIRLGAIGCTKSLCKAHDGKPSLRVDGFAGANILGFVDVGINAGWGAMRANVEPGTDGLSLYGIDVGQFPQEVQDMVNLDALVVQKARLDTVQAGFNLRAHFIPRGRIDAYVGAGAGYQLFRARYDTDAGLTRIAFHGLAFPLQAGFLVFVHKNIALGAQFDYVLTWYGAVSVRGAAGNFGAPLSRIAEQAEMAGVELPGDLPHLWTVGGVVHFRFGR